MSFLSSIGSKVVGAATGGLLAGSPFGLAASVLMPGATQILDQVGVGDLLDEIDDQLPWLDDAVSLLGAAGTFGGLGAFGGALGGAFGAGGVLETLQGLLLTDAAGKVDEESLFAGLTLALVEEVAPAGAAGLRQALESALGDPARSLETAAVTGLRGLVGSGALPKTIAEGILSQAFAAAQLDGNDRALFDGRGGPGDATIATEAKGAAISQALARLERFSTGLEIAPRRSLDGADPAGGAAARGGAADLGAGFLFKPESDGEGKLVILLPESLGGQVASLRLLDGRGRELEVGESSGFGNGNREHFRFDRPGAAYPVGLLVEVSLADGRVLTRTIADPSRRVE